MWSVCLLATIFLLKWIAIGPGGTWQCKLQSLFLTAASPIASLVYNPIGILIDWTNNKAVILANSVPLPQILLRESCCVLSGRTAANGVVANRKLVFTICWSNWQGTQTPSTIHQVQLFNWFHISLVLVATACNTIIICVITVECISFNEINAHCVSIRLCQTSVYVNKWSRISGLCFVPTPKSIT